METGKIIAKLREERNMVQKELAALLNVSSSTVSNYENGVHLLDPNTLCKLADLFETSVDYLLGRTKCHFEFDRWTEPLTKEYTLTDFADVVLTLNERERESVMWYAQFLKEGKHCVARIKTPCDGDKPTVMQPLNTCQQDEEGEE